MTVEQYIKAIKSATDAREILSLWRQVASESDMSIRDIVSVHRSCGDIVTDAALEIRKEDDETNPIYKIF
tara:strand:+ start:1668 stop:1877 length:210 start_codon:yes stop_codon:yes gene_type:complete